MYFDLHCDTIYRLSEDFDKGNLASNELCVDFNKMAESGALGRFFAIFVTTPEELAKLKRGSFFDQTLQETTAMDYINASARFFHSELEKNRRLIAFAGNFCDIETNRKNGLMSAMLSIEDGRAADNKFENIKHFHDLGVRLMNLTWNAPNCFGMCVSKDPERNATGLTSFGKQAVEYMNELGIIIDVSHLSDKSFSDVAEISKKPFIASHSNSRTLTPHIRNLTDEMVKTVAERGGVIGINFAAEFLDEHPGKENLSRVTRIADHMIHMINIGGIECIAIGSDLDGISCELEIRDTSYMYLLFDELKRRGCSDSHIEKITFANIFRVLKDCL